MTTQPVHSFAVELGRLRRKRGISQAELSRRAGVDTSSISRLECGERDPSRDMAERLAEALACSQSERAVLLQAASYHAGVQLDPALEGLNDYLTDPRNDAEERDQMRSCVESLTKLVAERQRLAVVRRSGRAA